MIQTITEKYSKATASMKHSFVREILALTKGVTGMISFAGGLPNPASFPRNTMADIFHETILKEGDDVLQYGASEGDRFLKQVIKKFEEASFLNDDEMVITVGSTNGIYYFTRTFIDPGDIILCEAPGYPGSLAAMEACGANVVGIEMDDKGMSSDMLKQTIRQLQKKNKKIKFIYVIPDFQNPSGRTMSLQRRREIIGVAEESELPILEDQPYRELRYSGKRLITLWELARTEFKDPNIVTIAKSFSKIAGPGLRLGFCAGPREVIGQLVKWAQKVTVSPDCVTQRAIGNFIQRGHMRTHIQSIINFYKPRRDEMLKVLKEYFPPEVLWTRPEGGMFIWVTFPQNFNTDKLFELSIKNGVAFIPGSKFYPGKMDRKHELRLNFSYPEIGLIHKGIQRLAELSQSFL